jgi:hypothetical protein
MKRLLATAALALALGTPVTAYAANPDIHECIRLSSAMTQAYGKAYDRWGHTQFNTPQHRIKLAFILQDWQRYADHVTKDAERDEDVDCKALAAKMLDDLASLWTDAKEQGWITGDAQ